MSVTIKDVAKQCGMSISTVSKVFNGYPDISEDTSKQVMKTARDMGYQPNALARALKTNRSYNLGVLFVDENTSGLLHPFFAAMLNAFKAESEARGYDITFINHHIGTTEMTYLEHCRYRNVDGVCLACVDFYSEEVAALVGSDIPSVTVDHVFDNRPCVTSDNVSGIRMLVDYAASQGHRRIAYIHGQRNSSVTETRVNGFYHEMKARDLPVPKGFVLEGRYDDVAITHRMTRRLLERPDRPTCILLPDDASCFGAFEAIAECGLRLGADVSVAGYDGIRLTQSLHPRLTTVYQDSETMGRQAALRLIDLVERPAAASRPGYGKPPVEATVQESPAPDPVVTIPVRLFEGETIARL